MRSLADIHTISRMKGAGSEPAKGLKTKAQLAKKQVSLSIYFSVVVVLGKVFSPWLKGSHVKHFLLQVEIRRF